MYTQQDMVAHTMSCNDDAETARSTIKLLQENKGGQVWWYTPFLPELRGKRQIDFYIISV